MTPLQQQCLSIIRVQIADDFRYEGGWLKPSYVMAHIEIESTWNPTVKAADYATTGSIGLMQVTRATAIAVGMGPGHDQTTPANSIIAGMRDIAINHHALAQHYGADSPNAAYDPCCVAAYNEGIGNVFHGYQDEAYVDKWRTAQQNWAFVDQEQST